MKKKIAKPAGKAPAKAGGTKQATLKKKTKVDVPCSPCTYKETKSVRIERAENGLTVRTWGKDGEQIMVAKSDSEAMRHAKKLLGE